VLLRVLARLLLLLRVCSGQRSVAQGAHPPVALSRRGECEGGGFAPRLRLCLLCLLPCLLLLCLLLLGLLLLLLALVLVLCRSSRSSSSTARALPAASTSRSRRPIHSRPALSARPSRPGVSARPSDCPSNCPSDCCGGQVDERATHLQAQPPLTAPTPTARAASAAHPRLQIKC
jgi:hypothetical protein